MSELRGMDSREVSFAITSFFKAFEDAKKNIKGVNQKSIILYDIDLLQKRSESIDVNLSNMIARLKLYVINNSGSTLDQRG